MVEEWYKVLPHPSLKCDQDGHKCSLCEDFVEVKLPQVLLLMCASILVWLLLSWCKGWRGSIDKGNGPNEDRIGYGMSLRWNWKGSGIYFFWRPHIIEYYFEESPSSIIERIIVSIWAQLDSKFDVVEAIPNTHNGHAHHGPSQRECTMKGNRVVGISSPFRDITTLSSHSIDLQGSTCRMDPNVYYANLLCEFGGGTGQVVHPFKVARGSWRGWGTKRMGCLNHKASPHWASAYGIAHFGNPYNAVVTQHTSKMDHVPIHFL